MSWWSLGAEMLFFFFFFGSDGMDMAMDLLGTYNVVCGSWMLGGQGEAKWSVGLSDRGNLLSALKKREW